MPSATGIELGPDSCVLVRARLTAEGLEVAAMHSIEPSEWPGNSAALVATLRAVRRTKRFPRNARVVSWTGGEGSIGGDPRAADALAPLRAAGFRIGSVSTPAQGLAALAATRRQPGAGVTAWLSVNTHGCAIAIVHGASLLFSRTVTWTFEPATGARGQLLQRYSMVAHIAPVLTLGIQSVRQQHSVRCETVVMCGNVPDLRSLTMPLIEELDLEVETLDSTDGLVAGSPETAARLDDYAPAIRVAAAAAITGGTSGTRGREVAAAGLVLAAAGVAAVYGLSQRSIVRPADPRQHSQVPLTRPDAPVAPAPTPTAPQTASEERRAVSPPPEVTEKEEARPAEVLKTPNAPAQGRPEPRVPRRPAAVKPSTDPLPRVTSILIGEGRRLAIVDGRIVRAGDAVGSRTVERIEEDAVVLKDTSGTEIRVPLRSRG